MADPDAAPPPALDEREQDCSKILRLADVVPRLAAAVYPDHPPDRARSKVWSAIRYEVKKNRLRIIDNPLCPDYVWSLDFFVWVARRWPGLSPWPDPYAARDGLISRLFDGDYHDPPNKQLPAPDDLTALRQENAALHREIEWLMNRHSMDRMMIKTLRKTADDLHQELRERDARSRKYGRRPSRE